MQPGSHSEDPVECECAFARVNPGGLLRVLASPPPSLSTPTAVRSDQQCGHLTEDGGAHWEAPAGEAAVAGGGQETARRDRGAQLLHQVGALLRGAESAANIIRALRKSWRSLAARAKNSCLLQGSPSDNSTSTTRKSSTTTSRPARSRTGSSGSYPSAKGLFVLS